MTDFLRRLVKEKPLSIIAGVIVMTDFLLVKEKPLSIIAGVVILLLMRGDLCRCSGALSA